MKPLKPSEISYIIEAKIRGISVNEVLEEKTSPPLEQLQIAVEMSNISIAGRKPISI